MTTTSRLLALLSLLQARRDWPGTLLAERLEVSRRTVRRDVDRLREMGYRIQAVMGPDGGYRLDAGSELPPLLFDDDQVIAVTVALQAAALSGAGVEEDALRALTTVRQVMPARLRHRLDALRFQVLPGAPGAAGITTSPDVLVAVSSAMRDHEVLRFDYHRPGVKGDDQAPPRRVEPHHLVASEGRWYVVAWDLEHGDWRIFRADRMTPRVPTGPRFSPREMPRGDAAAYVAARFKGSADLNRWPCTGTVILRLPAAAVRPFAGDGFVEPVDESSCRYESGSWSWIALAASLGRFDTEIEAVEPPELVAAFARLAERNASTAARG